MRVRQTGVYEENKGRKGRAIHHLSLILNPRLTFARRKRIRRPASSKCTVHDDCDDMHPPMQYLRTKTNAVPICITTKEIKLSCLGLLMHFLKYRKAKMR